MARTNPDYIGNPSPKDVYMNLDEKIEEVAGDAGRIPDAPSENGTYYLKVVKTSEGATYSWATLSPYAPPEDPADDGAYVLTRTIAEGAATDSWESAGE